MTTFGSSSATAVLGVTFVEKTCALARTIFREVVKHDVGLDGFIELVEDGQATGIIAGIQIKSGESFVSDNGTVFRFVADQNHFAYWGRCAFPVIGVVYDPTRDIALWVDIGAALTDDRIRNGPFTMTVRRAPDAEFNKDTLLGAIQSMLRSRSAPRRTLADIRRLLTDVAPSAPALVPGMTVSPEREGAWKDLVEIFLSAGAAAEDRGDAGYRLSWYFPTVPQSLRDDLIHRMNASDDNWLLLTIEAIYDLSDGGYNDHAGLVAELMLTAESLPVRIGSLLRRNKVPERFRVTASILLEYLDELRGHKHRGNDT